jgi:hypothetical protein
MTGFFKALVERSRTKILESRFEIIIFFGCMILYYVVIARRFLGGGEVIGGDTGLTWSLHYFVMEALVEYLQYPLWDPTTLGGYPSHMLMVNGWYQNLHPFHLPLFLVAAAIGKLFHIDSNYLVTFHKTIYLFSINLVAIMLITRELCTTRLARLLPPLIYTLCSFQFFALRDSLIVEGLPPALFLLFAVFYHVNRRSPRSLFVLLIFLALYVFGFSYAYLLSSAWWLTILILLVLLTSPGIAKDSWGCAQQLWANRVSRIQLILVSALLLVAAAAVAISIGSSVGQMIRASGGQPVPFDTSSGGQWDPPVYGIYSTQLWAQFLVWAPFPDIHQSFLKFDPWDSGIYHRYMGMVLLPLLLIAALFGHKRRFVWPLLVTVFCCAVFITYTVENPLYAFLVDNIPPLRNTRPLTYLLSRDVTLLTVFVGAVGLDILLLGASNGADVKLWTTARAFMIILVVVAGELLLASILPQLASIRHSLAHIAVYLGLFSLILLVLSSSIERYGRRTLVLFLLILTVMDLVISAASFSKHHVATAKAAPHALIMPTRKLGPLRPGDVQWVGGYRGQFHQLYGGPYQGTRAWLVVATHPSWQPILQNWDSVGRRMKAYPDFRFFTNAAYVPFDAILEIDKVKLPSYVLEPAVRLVRANGRDMIQFPDRVMPVEDGFAGIVENAHPEAHDDVAFAGWAIDERAQQPAREVLVFVGDVLLGSVSTVIESRIAARLRPEYLHSGFNGLMNGLSKSERKNIRLFALLSDGTARELLYADDYPFTLDYGPGPERLTMRPAAAGPSTMYLHDRAAVFPNVSGRLEQMAWSVVDWTPNHYTIRVSAPSDGYLLNLDNYNKFWTARVDGRPEEIARANFSMQAVKLSKGEHIVEWRYDPLVFKLGWLAFYAVFAAVLVSSGYLGMPAHQDWDCGGRGVEKG